MGKELMADGVWQGNTDWAKDAIQESEERMTDFLLSAHHLSLITSHVSRV
jgi:hypothetical protein